MRRKTYRVKSKKAVGFEADGAPHLDHEARDGPVEGGPLVTERLLSFLHHAPPYRKPSGPITIIPNIVHQDDKDAAKKKNGAVIYTTCV